eukprot:CAMPEP_0175898212 /NCGR_PEP_ID=MMETSP0108-20121206/1135_1 /TAXON_ID=195067 ORGANISM="Goniomonas pacifica, Strain CCMP1869" /NCGR_SAMPLE_ID=MMETSP0108 /ASSEMBLY_ACC=CAM_ASM_000204 /LENGTH=35 /DNA_ID= /DNA_START= /DNA_END= /DNA_ORIENTATION=
MKIGPAPFQKLVLTCPVPLHPDRGGSLALPRWLNA